MEVLDAPLQLQDLVVPRLDLVKNLFRRLGVVQDLNTTQQVLIIHTFSAVRKDRGS